MANFPQRRQRMSKVWAGAVFGESTLTVTQKLLTSISGASAVDETVLRSRGEVLIVGVPDAVTDDEVVGLGLMVVTLDAAGVGGVSLPGPIANLDADWLWHQLVPLASAAVTAGSDSAIGLVVRVPIDSKAMRKVPLNRTVVLVAELSTGEMSEVRVNGAIRILFGH